MTEPFACLDAHYTDSAASAACILFQAWDAPAPLQVLALRQDPAQAYEPGAFYKRELPLLLAVLDRLERPPGTVIVDGYVWLDDSGSRPGLGARLHRALGERIPVIGVAKTGLPAPRLAFPSCATAAGARSTSPPPASTPRRRPEASLQAQFRIGALEDSEAFLRSADLGQWQGGKPRVLIEYGEPDRILYDYVREENVDLVALGTHGRSALFEVLIGGVAQRLLATLPCDTLIVREPRAQAE